MRFTSWAVGRALELNPAAGKAMAEAGHEVASHGWRWINYKDFTLEQELDHMKKAVKAITASAGKAPVGWYTGRFGMHTLAAIIKHGGFLYSSDSYADDLPYWHVHKGKPQLMVPYTMDANDMRFSSGQGFGTGVEFFDYLRDSFDVLYAEGAAGAPKMMSIGLHCRLAGRPGRAIAVTDGKLHETHVSPRASMNMASP